VHLDNQTVSSVLGDDISARIDQGKDDRMVGECSEMYASTR
jgi:hypothetical protein